MVSCFNKINLTMEKLVTPTPNVVLLDVETSFKPELNICITDWNRSKVDKVKRRACF